MINADILYQRRQYRDGKARERLFGLARREQGKIETTSCAYLTIRELADYILREYLNLSKGSPNAPFPRMSNMEEIVVRGVGPASDHEIHLMQGFNQSQLEEFARYLSRNKRK